MGVIVMATASYQLIEALQIVKAAGYRVSKRRQRPTAVGLNAIGKPYGDNYDPNYRMKYRPSMAHLFRPYGPGMRFVQQ
jgi:hypothetical protein